MSDVIVIEQLTRRYGDRTGIEAVSIDVPKGALFGFLGPNGAGKTTTIRVLMGFLRPTSGRATILGRDVWRASAEVKQDVGYLPGDLRLYPGLTGRKLLRIIELIRRQPITAEGISLAERFMLDLDVTVRKMSRGMRQKLGLIVALAPRPKVLILDEPTTALDPLMQDALLDHLRDLAGAGHTVFFSSHSLSEVERLCDRVAIVREGRVVANERLETLRLAARREVTIRWDGTPPSDAPAVLEVERRDGPTWHGILRGPVRELLKWTDGRPIDDLVITPPDLESLFRRFYRPEDDSS